jgi:hypothetical protein
MAAHTRAIALEVIMRAVFGVTNRSTSSPLERSLNLRSPDILSVPLQARDHDGRAMDDEHLRDELMTLLITGHETTGPPSPGPSSGFLAGQIYTSI